MSIQCLKSYAQCLYKTMHNVYAMFILLRDFYMLRNILVIHHSTSTPVIYTYTRMRNV